MKKSEIVGLDNEELLAHLMNLETTMTHETNSRGITKGTIKEFKWTLEECCNRFKLDFHKMKKITSSESFWEDK